MEQNTEIFYSLNEARNIIEHPLADSEFKLIKFLHRFGILSETMPRPELIARGFFSIKFEVVKLDDFNKTVPTVVVSTKGIDFIKSLLRLVYED